MSKPKNMTPEQEFEWDLKRKAYEKEYRKNKSERISKQQKKYRKANREKLINLGRIYYKENRQKVLDSCKRWRANNSQYKKDKNKEWAAKNPDKIRAIRKRSREKNKDSAAEYKKRYRKEKKHLIQLQGKKYRDANRDKIKESNHKYRNINIEHIREKAKNKAQDARVNVRDTYIAQLLELPLTIAKSYPDILEAKRDQIKILRELRSQTKPQQCTRIHKTYKKSETTSPKPLTHHGLTSLLCLELSSWSTPWARQLTQLLLKSKPLNSVSPRLAHQ